MRWGRAILVLASLLLQACLEEKTTGGTSTETENAVARSISVDSLLGPDRKPPTGAIVVTLRFQGAGFDFSGTLDSGFDLDVRTSDSASSIPFEIVGWDRTARIGRLHVRLEPALQAAGSRFLLFWKLPAGRREDSAAVWKGLDSLRTEFNSVLVDDFEAGSLLHNRLPDSSFWYVGGSLISSGLASAGSGRTGTALHLVCGPGQCDTGRQLLAATLLSNRPRIFRSLDSVTLLARGSGRIWIALEHLDSMELQKVQAGHIDSLRPGRAWGSRPLTSGWSRVSLRPSDFLASDGVSGNQGWSAVRDSVNYLTVLIEGGSEMWIDDIRFDGLVREDLR